MRNSSCFCPPVCALLLRPHARCFSEPTCEFASARLGQSNIRAGERGKTLVKPRGPVTQQDRSNMSLSQQGVSSFAPTMETQSGNGEEAASATSGLVSCGRRRPQVELPDDPELRGSRRWTGPAPQPEVDASDAHGKSCTCRFNHSFVCSASVTSAFVHDIIFTSVYRTGLVKA